MNDLVLNLQVSAIWGRDVANRINSYHNLSLLLGQMLCQYSFNHTLQSCKICFVSFFPQIKKQRPQGAQKRYTEHRRAQVEAGMGSVPPMNQKCAQGPQWEASECTEVGSYNKTERTVRGRWEGRQAALRHERSRGRVPNPWSWTDRDSSTCDQERSRSYASRVERVWAWAWSSFIQLSFCQPSWSFRRTNTRKM